MDSEIRGKLNDLVKESIWNVILMVLAMLYWFIMLLIISFVLNSVLNIRFEQIVIISIVLGILTILIRIIKKCI